MTEFFNIILIKLIIAHLICDFFIQSDKFCEEKNKAGYKGWLLQLLHAFSHALIAYVLVAKWTIWQIPLVIGGSHLIIDIIKTKTKQLNSLLLFVLAPKKPRLFLLLSELQKYNNFNKLHILR